MSNRNFYIPDEVMAKLDHDRGDLSRSEYLRRLIMGHPSRRTAKQRPNERRDDEGRVVKQGVAVGHGPAPKIPPPVPPARREVEPRFKG